MLYSAFQGRIVPLRSLWSRRGAAHPTPRMSSLHGDPGRGGRWRSWPPIELPPRNTPNIVPNSSPVQGHAVSEIARDGRTHGHARCPMPGCRRAAFNGVSGLAQASSCRALTTSCCPTTPRLGNASLLCRCAACSTSAHVGQRPRTSEPHQFRKKIASSARSLCWGW